jgi:hypothetical protein
MRQVAFGTKRTWRDDLLFVRFWGKADVGCESALMVLAAFDPKRTEAGSKSRSAASMMASSDVGVGQISETAN